MNTNIFTLKDLKKFLTSQGFDWTGYIWSTKLNKLIKANAQELEHSPFQTLQIKSNNEEYFLDLNLSNFVLLTFDNLACCAGVVDKNLSSAWQDYLLNTYKTEYAEMLLEWAEGCKRLISKGNENERKYFDSVSSYATAYIENEKTV